jgi:hypothetical protein
LKLIKILYCAVKVSGKGVKKTGKTRVVAGALSEKKSENELSGSLARLGLYRWLLWVVIVYILYNHPQLCAVGVGSATICIAQV